MSITLSDHDKEIIGLIDNQVQQLIQRNAPEHVIVTTLMDFIPDVQCIANETCEKELELYCREHQHFNFFLQLIRPAVINGGLK
ncbi:hypothetical protein OQJ18_13490 [Fluoribacter dumoffii]|uniref:Uncharacterized protein n=1 Tax=Fluoribacter dumoffii TaxID=463 RepID=A0A377GF36_9GAMM|nr:hypothetical protein [Fluoribacter dumoffii]KTC91269.1 hypothetical protein Ldum_2337 [Fluoribacter dumoffii NY 23]MCW8387563.1 hypothetical protein [Fluoribacter dumoffii]MCW8416891.1 hypothetical protein [Fluoribacter dumoffii]MCW8455269.1 hypothetical protein [Fluoribacter dumoffii]MCW8460654.1 hypothetical protein [Fluoribacter dumoffii]